MFGNHIPNKGIVNRIYELSQFNKKTTQITDAQKTWIDISPMKTYKWPQAQKCLMSLVIRKSANQCHNGVPLHTFYYGYNNKK